MVKAASQFVAGVGLAFLAVAISPIMALGELVVALSSFIP